MDKLHRWDYNVSRCEFRCVDPGLGAVDSGQYCWPGCGAVVTDLQFYNSPWRDHYGQPGQYVTLTASSKTVQK